MHGVWVFLVIQEIGFGVNFKSESGMGTNIRTKNCIRYKNINKTEPGTNRKFELVLEPDQKSPKNGVSSITGPRTVK